MTIKTIKEKYKTYGLNGSGHNSFVPYDYGDGNGKVVIVVNIDRTIGDTVRQVVRVSDGREMLPEDSCRVCDNLTDAIDVAEEMILENSILKI